MAKISVITAVISAALFSTAAFAEEPPIKIGFAIAESGWMHNYDGPPSRAAIMKIDELNKAGGLLGRKIEYKTIDTKTERERSATAGAQLIQEGVDLLMVSADYDFGAPAALAAKNAGKIAFSLGAADPKMGVQGVGWQTFTPISAAQSEGITIAEYAIKKLGLKTSYVLEDPTIEYDKSACAGFRAAWTKWMGKNAILGNDSFKNDDPSIAAQITRIKGLSTKPDAIFICSYTPGGASAVRQLRAAGIDSVLLGDTAMSDNYWLNSAPGLKDFYVPGFMSLYGDDPRPAMNEFVKNHIARWGAPPVSSYAVGGYSAIEEWAYAVKKAGTLDAKKVVAVMETFKDQPFLIGPTTYTHQLHIQTDRPFLIMKTANDSFHAVELYRNEYKPDMKLLFRISQK